MNYYFLLPLLVTVANTVPVIPDEPSITHSMISITNVNLSHPTSGSAPASDKVTSSSKDDAVQILESKELDEESDDSDESEESSESNETSESQNSKEDLLSLQANVTKSAQSSKDSVEVTKPFEKFKSDPPSPTSVKTTESVDLAEPDAATVSVTAIRDATFSPSKL